MDIKLSDRMRAVANLAEGKVVADIGCDHGYISMHLVQNGFKKAVAMDLREGPLQMARTNVRDYGLEESIDIRLSDGFDGLLPGEADCAVIAGMGGILITDILKRGRIHTDNKITLVLQPQSDLDMVRGYLQEISYEIADEVMVLDEGKFYTAMKAVPAEHPVEYTATELKYGPVLIRRKDRTLKSYLTNEREKICELIGSMEHINSDKAADRLETLRVELKDVEATLQEVI